MKRSIIIALLLAPLAVSAAYTWDMFRYECEQVDPSVTLFTCKLDDGLQLHKTRQAKTEEEKKRHKYHWQRITHSYLELGGSRLEITASWWPKNAVRQCGADKAHTRFYCDDCRKQPDGSCKKIEK